MQLLVTGGAGFIGSHFIRYWLTEHPDDMIVNLDALTYAGHLETLKDIETNPHYQFVHGDITDEELVKRLVSNCDLIVHFAAESHVDRSITSSRPFITTNILGTTVLLEAARQSSKPPHFHHVSTDEVFGSLDKDDPKFSEETPYSPRSPYSASKAASDHLVRAYYHTYGLPLTISNCSNNYGPYQLPEKFIPLFTTNLLRNQKVPLYGTGENIRDWIYVVDHVKGIEAVIKKGRVGETYCLGGGNELSNIEIAKSIIKTLNVSDDMITLVSDRLGHDFRYAIDYGKAKKELGWQPTVDFNQGLQETIHWYQTNEWWWKPLVV